VGAGNRAFAFALVAAFGIGGVTGTLALLPREPDSVTRPVWSELQWPFATDQWGRGRAFECGRWDCGTPVRLYLRAKLGACNCQAGMADDDELGRMSDFDLLRGEIAPLGDGRAIAIASMKGRSRIYALTGHQRSGKTMISLAFNERCDMVVATVILAHDKPGSMEPHVIEFLNSGRVMQWVENALGL
jgi:hypothetical protein